MTNLVVITKAAYFVNALDRTKEINGQKIARVTREFRQILNGGRCLMVELELEEPISTKKD
jgi:hypothetical protein